MEKKVNINRPQISSDEIAKHKDVNSLFKMHQAGKPFYKKPWFGGGIGLATLAVITAVIVNQKKSDNSSLTTNQQNQSIEDTTTLANFYTSEQTKPCINPPIAGLDIPSTIFKVIAEKGAVIDVKTGSKINVPKNSFIDKTGQLLKGEIELHYREFHDPADFFVSGIPMTYDSAGTRYQFESAGMIEIKGFQDGKEVSIAPDKKINIELASTYTSTDYNLYKLDTEQNNWACLGKDKIIQPKSTKENAQTAQKQDVTTTKEYQTLENKIATEQKEKENKIATLPKIGIEPKKPEQARKDKYTFNLDVDAKEYPELALYKGVLFEVGNENKNFTSAMYNITWDEAVIKEGPKKSENYLLTLTKAAKKYEVVVYPVFEGKNYEAAQKEYSEKFSKYSAALEKRKAEEKRIEEAYQTHVARLKREEEDMKREWKEREENNFKLMSTQEKVQRMFAVNSFGVFNCDKPSLYPQGKLCNALLNNEQQKKLTCYEVFLVDREKNGLFTYTKNPVVKFSFNPNSKNLLWTVENGVLYWLKPEQFNEINGSANISELKLNKVEQKFKNVEELKAFFNF